MKNKINKAITVFLMLVLAFASSCKKKLTDLNVDSKRPATVSSSALFANAQKTLMDQIVTPNVNNNPLRMFSQYWTQTTYTDESKYNIKKRAIPDNEFRTMYRDVLMDLKECAKVAAGETDEYSNTTAIERKNKIAITEILSVYVYTRLVDIFGDVPYFETLDHENIHPKYDKGEVIYAALFARLDAAIAKLVPGENSFDSSDIIYEGDADAWKLFANSLKLKMAITVADVPSLNPGAKAQEAVTAGVFTSSSDNAYFHYLPSSANANPVWANLVASGRKDFVAANTIVDVMNGLNDPRRSKYFTVFGLDVQGNPIYKGGKYGYSNSYNNFSKPAIEITNPEWRGVLLELSEVLFYKAEAVERGFISGNASTFYDDAITTSFLSWGLTNADAAAYLADPNVAYATATGSYKQKIATQAWIAYYDRPDLGWLTWRRLDYPVLNTPANMTIADIPRRYTYPIQEQSVNNTNYTAAAAAIGGDLKSTKIFWDKF